MYASARLWSITALESGMNIGTTGKKKGQMNFVLKIFPVQSARWLIEVHFLMPIDQALMTVIRT
jgi:hypothetical protein